MLWDYKKTWSLAGKRTLKVAICARLPFALRFAPTLALGSISTVDRVCFCDVHRNSEGDGEFLTDPLARVSVVCFHLKNGAVRPQRRGWDLPSHLS